jgi:galactokinase
MGNGFVMMTAANSGSANSLEYVTTLRREERNGTRMLRTHYEALRDYMLEVLQNNNDTTINELLRLCHFRFEPLLRDNIGWYIYNVKVDLEVRGLIRSCVIEKRAKKRVILKSNSILSGMQDLELNAQTSSVSVNLEVKGKFIELFEKNPLIIHAPGRINLIGEHTDYNNGFVMPVAINKGVQFAINKSSNTNSLIYSIKYKEFLSIDHAKTKRVDNVLWQNYLLGVLNLLLSKGHKIRPFNCVFEGDLPLGAGLSSSAAIECGFVTALDALFNLNLSKIEMIQIAQWAEHHYVGVKCGIMDQYASIMGKRDHAILLDCQSLHAEYLPLTLNDYSILLLDTNVKHSLASSEYNTRREECEKGVRIIKAYFPKVKSLRDVTREMIVRCASEFPENILKRCLYVVQENQRVIDASKDLKNGDLAEFGKKMFASHDGLSRLYEVSCAELDFLVVLAKGNERILGSRMMGGGFGGCTINIIHNAMIGEFVANAKSAYKEKFGQKLSSYVVNSSIGATVIENP